MLNVSDLLDDLIEQSVALVGKPVALMNKAMAMMRQGTPESLLGIST